MKITYAPTGIEIDLHAEREFIAIFIQREEVLRENRRKHIEDSFSSVYTRGTLESFYIEWRIGFHRFCYIANMHKNRVSFDGFLYPYRIIEIERFYTIDTHSFLVFTTHCLIIDTVFLNESGLIKGIGRIVNTDNSIVVILSRDIIKNF